MSNCAFKSTDNHQLEMQTRKQQREIDRDIKTGRNLQKDREKETAIHFTARTKTSENGMTCPPI